MEINKIYHGDALSVLKTFPSEIIDMVMTSPPYWLLRDYGVEGQLGNEKTFQEYIAKLCDIFDEVKRVLKKEGTCFVVLGDTYAGSGNGTNDYRTEKNKSINGRGKYVNNDYKGIGSAKALHHELHRYEKRGKTNEVIAKSLCSIPNRFAIEMCNRGWILRNKIIWYKNNCMPSSVKDRYTIDYEEIFFFVKSKKYFFEQQFESMLSNNYDKNRMKNGRIEYFGKWYHNENHEKYGSPRARTQRKNFRLQSTFVAGNKFGRNKRCVWKIPLQPTKELHFATYPEKLCEIPIRSGCPKNGIVLDPFIGSGTTGIVALKQGKQFVGIELNKSYIEIVEKRIKPYLEQKTVNNFD